MSLSSERGVRGRPPVGRGWPACRSRRALPRHPDSRARSSPRPAWNRKSNIFREKESKYTFLGPDNDYFLAKIRKYAFLGQNNQIGAVECGQR